MALIEWTDANGHKWQADITDDGELTPELILKTPRDQGMRRVVVKAGGGRKGGMRWQRDNNSTRPPLAPTHELTMAYTLAGAGGSLTMAHREVMAARRARLNWYASGSGYRVLASVQSIIARRAPRSMPGEPYSGQDRR